MAEETTGIQAVDSLSANEFHVEINGTLVSGIFGVNGLHIRSVDLSAGRLVHQPLTITKMVQQDPELPFNQWTRETLANPTTKVTREIAVVAMDEGKETRRWVYQNAWISDIAFSEFDTGRDELIEERLTIQHNGVEEIWPEQEAEPEETEPETVEPDEE
ncbi:MAG: phage tail protein [Anaerolineae bacterium]|nr:phage tail protein [Anaerolineae bacterium]